MSEPVNQIFGDFTEHYRLLDEMEQAGLAEQLDQDARDLHRLIREHAPDYKRTSFGDMTLPLARSLHRLVMAASQSASLAAMQKELEEAKALAERLKLEAQIQAGEARAHIAIVQECYQIATGATGEPATWNGAEPIRKAFTAQAERIARLEEAAENWRGNYILLANTINPSEDKPALEAARGLIARVVELEEALGDTIPVLESLDTLRHIDPAFPALDNARTVLAPPTP